MLLSFYMILFVASFCWVKLCVALPQQAANAKRMKSLDYSDVYCTMKYTQFLMNAIGLISSDIKWASQREEWLFYSLSQLVKDVKLTFTVWASTLTWCFIALVWQLIHMRPVVCTTISVCFRGGGWGRVKMRWVVKCPQALQYCVYYTFFILHLSAFFSSLVFQVFVNFAKHQHGEKDSQAYDNPVDTSDELPLKSLKTSHDAEKV